jgi:acyl-CoA synthetase (AMP-forming)/AMP-acid ligase II
LAIIPDCDGTPLGPFSEDEFKEMKLPPDSPGEIVVTGKHVLQGYLNGIGDEETKIRVGETVWHRTGDAGTLDQHGRLWLLGRTSAKLPAKSAFPAIYPFSLEVALSEMPGVIRAAALAMDGGRAVAIEGSPGDRKALKAIFAWAGVDRWHFLPEGSGIPMDRRHNAKVNYRELRALLQRF